MTLPFSKEEIERIANSFRGNIERMTSKSNAWMATLNQFPNLKSLLSDDKRLLLFEVEDFIKKEKEKEKELIVKKENDQKKITTENTQGISETKNSESTTPIKESWGIGKGLPPEEEYQEPRRIIQPGIIREEIPHAQDSPELHSESLFNSDEVKYTKKTEFRKKLKEEYINDIEKRFGTSLR